MVYYCQVLSQQSLKAQMMCTWILAGQRETKMELRNTPTILPERGRPMHNLCQMEQISTSRTKMARGDLLSMCLQSPLVVKASLCLSLCSIFF
ncbi:MAG: hypothetical protein DRI81_01255 [Chloroflexi bacterium]|nr:MAG: hypothetical protein DRI81_01255 [Chloroflexota bacterium]